MLLDVSLRRSLCCIVKMRKKNRENDKKLLFIYFGRSEIGLGGGAGCDGAINSNNNSLM